MESTFCCSRMVLPLRANAASALFHSGSGSSRPLTLARSPNRPPASFHIRATRRLRRQRKCAVTIFLRRAQQYDAPDADADDRASHDAVERASVMRLSSGCTFAPCPSSTGAFRRRIPAHAGTPMPPSMHIASPRIGKRVPPAHARRMHECTNTRTIAFDAKTPAGGGRRRFVKLGIDRCPMRFLSRIRRSPNRHRSRQVWRRRTLRAARAWASPPQSRARASREIRTARA